MASERDGGKRSLRPNSQHPGLCSQRTCLFGRCIKRYQINFQSSQTLPTARYTGDESLGEDSNASYDASRSISNVLFKTS